MLGLEPPVEVRDSIRTMAGTDGIPERNDTIAESRITTDRYVREINRTQTGLTRIDGEKFNRGFAFLSSPDLIKTIQSLPGVAGGTELMSGLYVHGGTGTDNLFLLDGVPLYQVSHLAGLFSSFNTDVVESVDFYKSGFPARYGGRLSSVVDVRTREGDVLDRSDRREASVRGSDSPWKDLLQRGHAPQLAGHIDDTGLQNSQ